MFKWKNLDPGKYVVKKEKSKLFSAHRINIFLDFFFSYNVHKPNIPLAMTFEAERESCFGTVAFSL